MRLVELKAVRWVAKTVQQKVPLIAEKLVVLLVDSTVVDSADKTVV